MMNNPPPKNISSQSLAVELATWKKAFLVESHELAKRNTELNDLHDQYAIVAEKLEIQTCLATQRLEALLAERAVKSQERITELGQQLADTNQR